MRLKYALLGGIVIAFLVALALLRAPAGANAGSVEHSSAEQGLEDLNRGNVREIFEYNYERWKKHCEEVKFSSLAEARLNSPYYEEIVKLGPSVLPYLVEKVRQDPEFQWIGWAWARITKISGDPDVNPWAKEDRILDWWEGGQKRVNQRFESLYAVFKEYKVQGNQIEADNTAKSICYGLGIGALVPMMDKLQAGDTDVLPMIREITGGAANTSGPTAQKQAEACLAWWHKNKNDWIIPFKDN